MELFERYEELSRVIREMNAQAVRSREIPYILLHDYVHYCDVQTLFMAYARPLRLPAAQAEEWLSFLYRDTRERKREIGSTDLYVYTCAFFRFMSCRTGNLDTPDDCVEKLDMDILAAYRAAREKQWRGEALTPQEVGLLDGTLRQVLSRCGG